MTSPVRSLPPLLAVLLGCLATAAPSFATKSERHVVSVRATKFSLGSGVQLANPGVAVGPGGVLWFVSLSGSVGYLNTAGHVTPVSFAVTAPTGAPVRPVSVISGKTGVFVVGQEAPRPEGGPSQALWSAVAKIDPAGTASVVAEHLDPLDASGHSYISLLSAFGELPNGVLAGTSLEVSVAGVVSESPPLPLTPYASTVGPEGLAWIGGIDSGQIELVRVNADRSVSNFSTAISASGGFLTNLVVTPGGSVWWGGKGYIAKRAASGKVSRYTVPGTPESLLLGPDSKMWFTTDLNTVGTKPRIGELSARGVPTLFSFRPVATYGEWDLWRAGKTVWLTPWSSGFVYKLTLR